MDELEQIRKLSLQKTELIKILEGYIKEKNETIRQLKLLVENLEKYKE